MKSLTPAKLVGLVFVLLVVLIVGFVVKRVMFAEVEVVAEPEGRVMPTALAVLEPGTVVKQEHLGRARFNRKLTGDELLSEGGIIGRVVKRRIDSAVPIMASDLFPLGQGPPLAVSTGYRAMTINVQEESAIMNGLLKPGQHVDIQWTPDDSLQRDPRMEQVGGLAMVLFRGVQVLAINKSFTQEPLEAAKNSITVEVAEEDATILRLAERHGKIAVAFTTDSSATAMVQVADPNRATLEELLGLDPVPEPEPEPTPEPPYVSMIYRGPGMQRAAFRNGVPIPGYNYQDFYRNPQQPVLQSVPGQVPGQPGQPAPAGVPGQPAPGYFLGPSSGLPAGAAPSAPASREQPDAPNLTARPSLRRN